MKKIHIFCALPYEAEAIKDSLGLAPVKNGHLRRFEDQEGQISLTVTGTGKTASACAVGYEMGANGSKGDVLINAGIAGGSFSVGEVFLINRITDNDTGRSFYPDDPGITGSCPGLKECGILCSSSVCFESDIPAMSAVDMESSSFFEAASSFTGPNNIHVIKVISDNGDHKKVTPDDVRYLTLKTVPVISAIIEKQRNISDEPLYDGILYEQLAEDLRCSEYMRNELKQLLIYAKCDGIDAGKIRSDLMTEGILPVTNKKDGTKALGEFKRRVAYI
ncbi:MAG: hypothetical protein J5685_06975 [Clostridiales bacterium]|nr:hypothetical protein [Clostridiales bacterium]